MAIVHDIHRFEVSLLDRARAAFADWRARRAAFAQVENELSVLSDRELNDLGLSRYDIPRVAREAAAAV